MWIVLSSCSDTSAGWALVTLRELGLAPLEWLQTEALLNVRCWEHRVGLAGVSTNIILPDGRAVPQSDVDGVINRMIGPPQNQVQLAAEPDREYAQSELTAFYL